MMAKLDLIGKCSTTELQPHPSLFPQKSIKYGQACHLISRLIWLRIHS